MYNVSIYQYISHFYMQHHLGNCHCHSSIYSRFSHQVTSLSCFLEADVWVVSHNSNPEHNTVVVFFFCLLYQHNWHHTRQTACSNQASGSHTALLVPVGPTMATMITAAVFRLNGNQLHENISDHMADSLKHVQSLMKQFSVFFAF